MNSFSGLLWSILLRVAAIATYLVAWYFTWTAAEISFEFATVDTNRTVILTWASIMLVLAALWVFAGWVVLILWIPPSPEMNLALFVRLVLLAAFVFAAFVSSVTAIAIFAPGGTTVDVASWLIFPATGLILYHILRRAVEMWYGQDMHAWFND